MKSRWFITLFAAIPFTAALLVLQSCGGEGGPNGGGGGGGGFNVSEQFKALWSDQQKAASYIGAEACANAACHGGAPGEGGTIYEHWKDTAHANKGVDCERCHGPGSAHQADPSAGNIVSLPNVSNPVVCAQCHGKTNDDYNFSQHSKIIVAPVEEAYTNPANYGRNSRCVACHSGLFRIENELGNDIGAMDDATIQELAEETQLKVPQSANCATCHNPHSKTGNVNADGEEVQLRHKTFNEDTTVTAPGTTAGTFTNFDHICAQCHNGRGADGRDAKLTSSTSRPNMHDSNQFNMLMGFGGADGGGPVLQNTSHATAPGQCSKCHMPDARHTFTVSYDKGCAPCHTAADAAARVQSERDTVLSQLLALKSRMETWAQSTYGNDLFWEYTSTITAEGFTPPNQSGVPIQIKRARHNYYFVVRSGDYGVHNAPYVQHLMEVSNQWLDELNGNTAVKKLPKMTTEQMLKITEADRARARKADLSAN